MHLWLLLIPLLVVGFGTVLRTASGPFWIGRNLDPEYAYLMNSLSLSQGLPVGHAHHPGSTLQWAGAIWLHGINFFLGEGDLITDVLTRPEFYMAHMHRVLLTILFLSLLIAGWLAFRWTGEIVVALLMQLGIFLSVAVRHSLSRVSPEPLLIILGIWLGITILYHHHLLRRGKGIEPYWQYGLIGGLGMGLKLTFLPPWFLPLILLKGFRHRFLYLGISGIVFFILAANPLMNFNGFIEFTFNDLIARQGHNQPIVLGSNKIQAMLDGLSLLFRKLWIMEKPLLLFFLLFVGNGFLVLFVKSYRQTDNTASWNIRLWVGFLLTLAGQILLVANGPKSWPHYLCPVLGLMGLFAASIWKWPDKPQELRLWTLSWRKAIYLAFMLLMIGKTLLNLSIDINYVTAGAKKWQEANRFKMDNQLLNETTVFYYRSSSIPYALGFGNALARRNFSQELSSLYPNFYFFSPLDGRIRGHFSAEQLTFDDVVNLDDRVLVQGQTRTPPIIPLLEQTGYYEGAPGPSLKPSKPTSPTEVPQEFSAEVLFRGSVEWIVLLQSLRHKATTQEMTRNPYRERPKDTFN